MQIETALNQNNYTEARSILASITSTNVIEENYILFYDLYCKYLQSFDDADSFTDEDSSSLVELSSLCAGLNGTSVYQARALYNTIYGRMIAFDDCAPNSLARLTNFKNAKNKDRFLDSKKIKVYPIPATDNLKITVPIRSGNIGVEIKDATERILFHDILGVTANSASFYFNLAKGIYLITVTLPTKESFTTKIIIN